MLLLKQIAVLIAQRHDVSHVDLVEGRQHGGCALGLFETPRDRLPQTRHAHALFARRIVGWRRCAHLDGGAPTRLDAAPPADAALRARLEAVAAVSGVPALYGQLAALDPAAAQRLHPNDRVRIIRAIEKHGSGGGDEGGWARAVSPWQVLLVGLCQERGALNRRLEERAHGMLAGGMMDEVTRLLAGGYDETAPGMAGIGYRQFVAVAKGRMTEAQALGLMVRDTRRYAKRQMTWFARDVDLRWLDVDETGGAEGAADRIVKEMTGEGWIP